jgi:hypothetical protein
LTTANTPRIAKYALNTPRITLRIAVLLIKKVTKSAFTLPALAGSHSLHGAAANVFTLSAFDPRRC